MANWMNMCEGGHENPYGSCGCHSASEQPCNWCDWHDYHFDCEPLEDEEDEEDDDIVTRLRNYDFMRDGDTPEVTMGEAADEIERLRTELQLAHSQIAVLASAKIEEEPF